MPLDPSPPGAEALGSAAEIDPATPSLRARFSQGIFRITIGRVAVQLAQFGITALLARALSPREFGLMAVMVAVLGIANLLSDAGLGTALVRRKSVDGPITSSIFWMSLALGGAWALLCAPFGLMIARWYHQPVLFPMMVFGGFTFLLRGAATVPNSLLLKRLEFGAINSAQIASTLIAGLVAVSLAFSGAGVFSLVLQQVVQAAVFLAGVWLAARWRPSRVFDRSALRETMAFSVPLLAFNIGNYIARNIDDLLVARRFGPGPEGLYSRAYQTMLLPLSQVSAPLGAVLLPALAEMQDDNARLKHAYIRIISILALVSMPMMAGLAVVAEPFTLTLYGERWREMATLVPILAVAGAVQSIETTIGTIFVVKGATRQFFFVGTGANLVLVLAIVFAIALGGNLTWVAAAYSIGAVAVAVPSLYVTGKLIGAKLTDVGAAILGPVLCSLAMAALVWLGGRYVLPAWPAPLRLVILAGAGVSIYAVIVHLSNLKAYRVLRAEVIGAAPWSKFFKRAP